MEYFFNKPYDASGETANKGHLVKSLYDEILQHPFLRLQPPKSCGREEFGVSFTKELIKKYHNHTPEDIIHTLTIATADTMVDAIEKIRFK